MNLFRFASLGLIASLVALPDYAAAAPGPITRGKAVAQQYCGGCHNLALAGGSRNRKAPPFRTLAQKYPIESLEEALAEGIMVGHEATEMPVFEFQPGQISDLLTYVRSLKKKK